MQDLLRAAGEIHHDVATINSRLLVYCVRIRLIPRLCTIIVKYSYLVVLVKQEDCYIPVVSGLQELQTGLCGLDIIVGPLSRQVA